MERLYQPTPDGYCGDEDNGQTSAWYVFSALGFYPVCPGTDQYVLGSPLFKKVTLKLENGREFVISAPENSKENKYVEYIKLNKKSHLVNWISHSDILKGGVFELKMTATPNKMRGTTNAAFPHSISTAE